MFNFNLTCSHFPSEEDGEHEKKKIWYYSTKAQLEELMERLDKEYWETDLHSTLAEMKEEVQAHMAITEDLTNKARGNNKAYLTAVNGTGSILVIPSKMKEMKVCFYSREIERSDAELH